LLGAIASKSILKIKVIAIVKKTIATWSVAIVKTWGAGGFTLG
jgi:hypothetical protein